MLNESSKSPCFPFVRCGFGFGIKLYPKVTGKYIKITAVYEKALGKFTDEDSRKEGFENKAEFRQYWEKNIGVWNPDKIVWVHEYELV